MDVNGTRFHLLKGKGDWITCCRPTAGDEDEAVKYDGASASLILREALARFPRSKRDEPLRPTNRRGAAVDGYGNWYWIDQERRRLYWQPSGTNLASVYYDPQQQAPESKEPGGFRPDTPKTPPTIELSGLAVTEDHYLVVGDRGDRPGLIIIDLHAGAPPWRFTLPGRPAFDPWDMAAAPGGGVWILDRYNHRYWGLDRAFRVVGAPLPADPTPPAAGAFHTPEDETGCPPSQPVPTLSGFSLTTLVNPLSIVPLPDLSVLILDSPPGASFSIIHHYAYDIHLASYPLEDETHVASLDGGQQQLSLQMIGHDIAYDPAGGQLYVMERDGNQAVAWRLMLDASSPGLEVRRSDYLPMPYGGGRAIVFSGDGVSYDVGGREPGNDSLVRWIPVRAIDRSRYERSATLIVGHPPADGTGAPAFDSKAQDCVWHRLLLDACIPPDTNVRVWSRAHNERELLANLPFDREPDLYLRGDGAEIPFYDPYPQQIPTPDHTGTWELLLQHAKGRYLQLRLKLTGNGHVTPRLRAMRVYYPRFSYPTHYLPAVYTEEGQPGPFLERMLANMEGFYSTIEGKIAGVAALFDPRTAPPEALDWLAGWVGLMLDPIWGQLQQKRAETDRGIQVTPGSTRPPDRRRLFIRFARLLYERRGTPDGILFALQLLLEPCLEQLMHGLEATAIDRNHPLRTLLADYDLPAPTATTSATELEDLLFDFLLRRPTRVRLVEHFLIRRGQGRVAGLPDVSAPGTASAPQGSSLDAFRANAHRFTVLVPVSLIPEEEAMVRRVVALEKPAHTEYALRRYWEGFRVSEARLGSDTTLDQTNRFVAMLIGRDYVADGYLAASHPKTVTERLVMDRDRYRDLPRL
jgi:phage tail-like protein